MSFLYPTFLFALAAVAIPVIIHLFNFRRYKTVYFSNVRFLTEVKEQTDSRSRLKHLLILFCRMLAITFLVFAFAQPFISSKTAPVAAGKKAVSIFIDNSFSMGQLSADVPLLDLAKLKAREIVTAYDADDLFQLLTQDFEARHQRLVDKEEMINLIKEVKISPKTHTITDIISRQKQALLNSGAAQQSIYVLSDFQKNFSDFNQLKEDTTIQTNLVPLHARELSNLYIDTCWTESPVQIAGQANRLIVKLINDGPEPLDNGRLTLQINGLTKAISNFSIKENSTVYDTINYTVTDTGWNRVAMSVIDHPIVFDDTYYMTYLVSKNRNVLIINQAGENPYLNALFGKNDFFALQNINYNQLNYADLARQQFVILNGLDLISSGLSAELKKFAEQGGNLLIFPSAGADLASLNGFLQNVGADIFSGFITQNKTVQELNTRNAVFADVFQQVPQNISLPSVTGSYQVVSRTNTTADPLLIFGDRSFLICKYVAGNGLLFLATVPLDKKFTDLPLNPLFAPMVYKMAVMKETAAVNAMVIGKSNLVSIPVDLSNGTQILHLKGATEEMIPGQRLIANQVVVSLNNDLDQAGIFSLQTESGQVRSYIALNYDRRESDLHFLSNTELDKISKAYHIKVIQRTDRDLSAVISGQRLGFPLWKVSVIFVLFFMSLEIVLLKFWK